MLSPTFMHNIQCTLLLSTSTSFLCILTGLSPSMVLRSRRIQIKRRRCDNGHTTSPIHFCTGFSLPFAAFNRPYSQHPNWFLFLRVLRRFNSPSSPSSTDLLRSRIQKSSVQRLLAPRRSLSQLATSFIAYLAKPST